MAADLKRPALQPALAAGGDGSAALAFSSSAKLERLTLALRLSVDVACAGVLLFGWSAGEGQGSRLVLVWVLSYLAIPPARIVERVRQHTMSSAVLLLAGIWLIANVLLSAFSARAATLSPLRPLFEGLMFTLTALSNFVASKAYPEHETTRGSLACGVAAVAAGLVSLWLGLLPG